MRGASVVPACPPALHWDEAKKAKGPGAPLLISAADGGLSRSVERTFEQTIAEWIQNLESVCLTMGKQLADEIHDRKTAPDAMLRNAAVVIAGVISALRERDADTLAEWAAPTSAYMRKDPKRSDKLEILFVSERSQVLRELCGLYAQDVQHLKELKINDHDSFDHELNKAARLLVEHILDYEPNRLPFLEPAKRKSASSASNVLPPDHADDARRKLAEEAIVKATRKALANSESDQDAAERALKAAFRALGLPQVDDLFSFQQKASKRTGE